MTTWIVSAGDKGRDYADHFFRFGMAFVGGDGQRESMMQVVVGDTVLLKRGLSEFLAAGRVVERDGAVSGDGDKAWLRDFDGWDLAAWCHVEWHRPESPEFATGLKMGTIYQTRQLEHFAAVERLLQAPVPALAGEPHGTQEVDLDTILGFLIRLGLRISAAEDLTDAIRRIRLLADYYYDSGRWDDVREHETRTFLVVPLLLALGWAEQQLKIEFPVRGVGRVDIACFTGPFLERQDEDVVVLIETKGFASGLDFARAQAVAYATHFKNCRVILVTNGYCYKLYRRTNEGVFSTAPSAYLNILKPKDRYPLDPDNVAGATEVLKWLMPASFRHSEP